MAALIPKIWHIKGHAAYQYENSPRGVLAAIKARFAWLDVDIHAVKDKDGHWRIICGHWGSVLKDHMVLTPLIRKKYGNNPTLERMLYEDILLLRGKVTYQGKTYETRYYTADFMLRFVKARSNGLGIYWEEKGSPGFQDKECMDQFMRLHVRHKMAKRVRIRTLRKIPGWDKRVKVGRAAGFPIKSF